jgi:hypothetical protein
VTDTAHGWRCIRFIEPLIAWRWHGGLRAQLRLSNCAMQQRKSSVGPRGWAMLTLVGGAALATPFLRPPQVDVDGLVTESPLTRTNGPGRLASLESTANGLSDLYPEASEPLRYDFAQQLAPPAGGSPSRLPAWAPARSPIDQLISQGTAPPWQSNAASVSTIKPLDTWVNAPPTHQPNATGPREPQPALPSTAARAWPEASSLPIANSAPAPGRSLGSLTGRSQNFPPATTPQLRAPANSVPVQPQYVFQPGFGGAAAH